VPQAIRTLRLLGIALAFVPLISATTGSSATTGLSATTGSEGPAKPIRARAILPAEGLVAGSVTALPDQKALDAHYYLADEDILGLGRKTDAVIARYEAGTGEALLLVVVYPSAKEAGRVYGRFGRDFFSGDFDPAGPRFVERIETGDWAGAARRGPVLTIVLEAPDRPSCEVLLGRAEDRAAAVKIP
jgi:hypothetical protein